MFSVPDMKSFANDMAISVITQRRNIKQSLLAELLKRESISKEDYTAAQFEAMLEFSNAIDAISGSKKKESVKPPVASGCDVIYLASIVKDFTGKNGVTMGEINELGYLANQILEVGSCGFFDKSEHPDYYERINKYKIL